MVFVPHTRVTCSGVFGSLAQPIEIFSYGFAIGAPGEAVVGIGPISSAALTAMGTAIQAYHSRAGTGISNVAILTSIKFAQIAPDGTYVTPPQILGPLNTPGNVSSLEYPPQVSYCVSTTGPPAVRPVKGRWYVPCPTQAIGPTTFKMGAPAVLAALNSAALLVEAVNDAMETMPGGPWKVVIASQGRAGGVPPQNAEVRQVRVGDVLDTQRRRRNALVEAYQSADIAP